MLDAIPIAGRWVKRYSKELLFRRYTQPEKDHQMLLAQLGWQLPEQPPPRISVKGDLLD